MVVGLFESIVVSIVVCSVPPLSGIEIPYFSLFALVVFVTGKVSLVGSAGFGSALLSMAKNGLERLCFHFRHAKVHVSSVVQVSAILVGEWWYFVDWSSDLIVSIFGLFVACGRFRWAVSLTHAQKPVIRIQPTTPTSPPLLCW